MTIGTKYHSNSTYPPKFLVQFEAKYLPQIAPEAVSEHEYVKYFLGGMPPDPPRGVRILVSFWICHLCNPPKPKCLDPPLRWHKQIRGWGKQMIAQASGSHGASQVHYSAPKNTDSSVDGGASSLSKLEHTSFLAHRPVF